MFSKCYEETVSPYMRIIVTFTFLFDLMWNYRDENRTTVTHDRFKAFPTTQKQEERFTLPHFPASWVIKRATLVVNHSVITLHGLHCALLCMNTGMNTLFIHVTLKNVQAWRLFPECGWLTECFYLRGDVIWLDDRDEFRFISFRWMQTWRA